MTVNVPNARDTLGILREHEKAIRRLEASPCARAASTDYRDAIRAHTDLAAYWPMQDISCDPRISDYWPGDPVNFPTDTEQPLLMRGQIGQPVCQEGGPWPGQASIFFDGTDVIGPPVEGQEDAYFVNDSMRGYPRYRAIFEGSVGFNHFTVKAMVRLANTKEIQPIMDWFSPGTSAYTVNDWWATGDGDGGDDVNRASFLIFTNQITGDVTLRLIRGDSGSTSSVVPIEVGVWYKVAVTYDGTDARFYLNGELVGTDADASGNIVITGGHMRVGQLYKLESAAATVYYFNGWMAHVEIYQDDLTQAELLGQYELASDFGGVVHTTVAYAVADTDDVILADGTFTVTLPTAVGDSGRIVTVRNDGTGDITVDAPGAEDIDGTSTFLLDDEGESVTVISDGADWFIIRSHLL